MQSNTIEILTESHNNIKDYELSDHEPRCDSTAAPEHDQDNECACTPSVRKLTNETVPEGRYRWYVTNTGTGSVGNTVATVR
jgi:hypothetical protein